jgi:hypothetical protein
VMPPPALLAEALHEAIFQQVQHTTHAAWQTILHRFHLHVQGVLTLLLAG